MPAWNVDATHQQYEIELAQWFSGIQPLIKRSQLIGYWPGFLLSSQLYDLSLNNRHMTNNGATAVTVSAPHHLNFAGAEYLELPHVTFAGSSTFGGWFKFASFSSEMTLISKGSWDGTSQDEQALFLGPASSYGMNALVYRGAQDDDGIHSSFYSQAVPLNQWCFLAGSYEEGAVNLKINDWGVQHLEPDFDPNTGNALSFRIGIDSNGLYPFTGQAAKLFIINEALSLAELNQIYNHTRIRFNL